MCLEADPGAVLALVRNSSLRWWVQACQDACVAALCDAWTSAKRWRLSQLNEGRAMH